MAARSWPALDRQHPRDLFDVRDLLANEGIGDETRRAFIVYLVSTNRPFGVILAPTRLDIALEFARGFDGMTDSPVTLDGLIQAREHLIAEVVGRMPMDHRRFLLSLKKGDPEWPLLGVPGAEAARRAVGGWRISRKSTRRKGRPLSSVYARRCSSNCRRIRVRCTCRPALLPPSQ
jgi:hypothetical protein